MKLLSISALLSAGLLSVSVSAAEPEEFTAATAVTIASLQTTNSHAASITITDTNTVATLVRTIQAAPGKWKRGRFTVPAGHLSFAFGRGSQVIAVIRLGNGFMVRGSGGHWEYKEITKELENRLSAFR